MNLYQINQQLLDTIEQADPETGEINLAAFEELQLAKTVKQENIARYIKHLENDSAILSLEADRIKKLKDMNAKRQEWMKSYLKQSMSIDGIDTLDFPTLKVKIKLNPPKVEIDDEEKLLPLYGKEKVTVVLDKAQIKKDLQAGSEVSGARLVSSTRIDIQ